MTKWKSNYLLGLSMYFTVLCMHAKSEYTLLYEAGPFALLTLSTHAHGSGPLLNISPLERLSVSQSVPHTQRAAKVVWFSLKMLRCRARALPSLYSYVLVGHFYSATYTRACA